MEERRTYPRETLSAAMICEFNFKRVSTHCVVRNISLDGALVECPLAEGDTVELEVGDRVALWDILDGDRALFDGDEGYVVWIYKRFIGLSFPRLLKDTPESLRQWLESNNLV